MKYQMMLYAFFGAVQVLLCNSSFAQFKQVLTPEIFIQQVRQFHPFSKQAHLITENARADLLSARGAFDPVFEMNTDQKTLDGTNYYRYSNPEIKFPTLLGLNIKTGVENSSGRFINPELTNGVASYIGAEMPLLNGLLTDKRRAILQQAKIYQQQSVEERALVMNDLLLEAYSAYWKWTASYELYRIYNDYVDIASKRMQLVRLTFLNGDRSLADTVEAFTQLQAYQLLQAAALQDLNSRKFELSQYLWNEEENPYLLPEAYVPDTTQFFKMALPLRTLDELLPSMASEHPQLKVYRYKLESLEVDRKLKFQNLLPVVNLRANILSKEYFAYKGFDAAYLENNYKFGITMKLPLLLRQGRADYKRAQLKIRETGLQLSQKAWQLQSKISQYYNEAQLLKKQIEIASNMYRNYSMLLRTEELKFSQGESSLFLINSRETKTLEMQQKLIELQLKYVAAFYTIEWLRGAIE
jgi:outer membrane protein TolC